MLLLTSQPLQEFPTLANAPIVGGILDVVGFIYVAVIPAIASFSTVVQTSEHNCYCRHCCSACWLPNYYKSSLLLLVLLLQEASLLLLALLLLLSFLLLLVFLLLLRLPSTLY